MTFMSQKHETDFAFTAEDNYGRHIEPTYGGALSFLRRRYTRDLTGVDVAVTGIPFDTATSNRPGARFGPRGIRAASSFMAWERLYPWEFDAFERLAVIDYGDCMFDPGVPEQVPAEIRAHAKQIIDQGPALLSLGGDHFATCGTGPDDVRRDGTVERLQGVEVRLSLLCSGVEERRRGTG